MACDQFTVLEKIGSGGVCYFTLVFDEFGSSGSSSSLLIPTSLGMTVGMGLTGEEDHLIVNFLPTKEAEPMEATIDVSSNIVLFLSRGDFSFDFVFFVLI